MGRRGRHNGWIVVERGPGHPLALRTGAAPMNRGEGDERRDEETAEAERYERQRIDDAERYERPEEAERYERELDEAAETERRREPD
jgi:hypothetical protein